MRCAACPARGVDARAPDAVAVEANRRRGEPVRWLLWALLKSIGLPFFLLATSAPLLQKWFSRTRHRAATDPYFLYAASNFGSLAGLLLYPLVVEPLLPLRSQAGYWNYGYMALRRSSSQPARCSCCGAGTGDEPAVGGRAPIERPPGRPSLMRRLRWIALSFAPSSLMLAVTTFISTELPPCRCCGWCRLALYLLTFVLAFSSPPRYPAPAVDRGLPL